MAASNPGGEMRASARLLGAARPFLSRGCFRVPHDGLSLGYQHDHLVKKNCLKKIIKIALKNFL